MKRYVAGFMFDAVGEHVAVVRKRRPDWQRGLYNGIGGHIEEGETPSEAMSREFHEEAGVLYPKELWKPLVRLYRPGAFEVYFYSAHTDSAHDVHTMTDEAVDCYPVSDILNGRCVPSVKWLIPMALDPNINREKFIEIEDVRGN